MLLWWLRGTSDLSDELNERISTELEVYVSAVSVWEISIKKTAGKLKVPDNLAEWIGRGGLSDLPIRMMHADVAGRLPAIHRDPFDRMLIAQALRGDLLLVSDEALFDSYGVNRLW